MHGPTPTHTVEVEHLRATITRTETAEPTRVRFVVDILIEAGWKLFGTGAENGLPISLSTEPPRLIHDLVIPPGELTGHIQLTATLDTVDEAAPVTLRYQLCSGAICQRPGTLELPLPPTPATEPSTASLACDTN